MSENTNDEIAAKLLNGLRNRIENKTADARKEYRKGDREWFENNREVAGRHYRAALLKYSEVTDLRKQYDELSAEWLPTEEPISDDTRWKVVSTVNHRGVGEGDAGLPGEDASEAENLEDARRAAIRPQDESEEIPGKLIEAYTEARKSQPKGPIVIFMPTPSEVYLAGDAPPWCNHCTEPSCNLRNDGTCAQIRRYMDSYGITYPAECDALNPHLPGFVGAEDTAVS